jgi:hypothetical protein
LTDRKAGNAEGDCYEKALFGSLDSGRVLLVISTATISQGVDLKGVGHVAIRGKNFDDVAITQMIGRCGRRDIGFALIEGDDVPPDPDAGAAPVESPTGLHLDIVSWCLMRMSHGQNLIELENRARHKWADPLWQRFLDYMPLPRRIDFSQEIKHIDLSTATALFSVTALGSYITVAPKDVVRYCQASTRLPRILAWVEKTSQICFPVITMSGLDNIIPATQILLYWAGRGADLPTLSPGNRTQYWPNTPDRIEHNFRQAFIKNSVSGEENPLLDYDDATQTKIVTLCMLTLWYMLGHPVGWASAVPRQHFPDILRGVYQAGFALSERCNWLTRSGLYLRDVVRAVDSYYGISPCTRGSALPSYLASGWNPLIGYAISTLSLSMGSADRFTSVDMHTLVGRLRQNNAIEQRSEDPLGRFILTQAFGPTDKWTASLTLGSADPHARPQPVKTPATETD